MLEYEKYNYAAHYRLGECFLTEQDDGSAFSPDCAGAGETVLWGDSHAAALAAGFLSKGGGV